VKRKERREWRRKEEEKGADITRCGWWMREEKTVRRKQIDLKIYTFRI
jgi:hypothetical protein